MGPMDLPQPGDLLAVPAFSIDPGELAAYHLSRMSQRLGSGVGRVPDALMATCPIDLVIGRTAAALGRCDPLRRFRVEVVAPRRITALAPVRARQPIGVDVRVDAVNPGPAAEVTLSVRLHHDAEELAGFLLDLVLRPRQ
jgi:hypothetical protein